MKKGGLATVIQLSFCEPLLFNFCNLRKILDARVGVEPTSSVYVAEWLYANGKELNLHTYT